MLFICKKRNNKKTRKSIIVFVSRYYNKPYTTEKAEIIDVINQCYILGKITHALCIVRFIKDDYVGKYIVDADEMNRWVKKKNKLGDIKIIIPILLFLIYIPLFSQNLPDNLHWGMTPGELICELNTSRAEIIYDISYITIDHHVLNIIYKTKYIGFEVNVCLYFKKNFLYKIDVVLLKSITKKNIFFENYPFLNKLNINNNISTNFEIRLVDSDFFYKDYIPEFKKPEKKLYHNQNLILENYIIRKKNTFIIISTYNKNVLSYRFQDINTVLKIKLK